MIFGRSFDGFKKSFIKEFLRKVSKNELFFRIELKLLKSQLSAKDLKNFKTLNSDEKCSNLIQHLMTILQRLEILRMNLKIVCKILKKIEPILLFMSFPFGNQKKFEEMPVKIADLFAIGSAKIENEIIALNSDTYIHT